MPELPEIKRYAHWINEQCKDLTFIRVTCHLSKYPQISVLWSEFKISAKARGKELCLIITPAHPIENSNNTFSVCFTHGLVGTWKFTPSSSIPQHAHVQFHTGSHTLSFVDSMKMGTWSVGGWSKDRGHDPVDEYEQFYNTIVNSLHLKVFDREICEVLLDQQYFNGIGNYLRAECLYRAGVNPFEKAKNVFKNIPKKFDFAQINENCDRGLILIYLCKAIPLEVLEKGLNKYGTDEEQAKFNAWLRIYNKGQSKKDKKGRTMHYSPQQLDGTLKPDIPVLKTNNSQDALRLGLSSQSSSDIVTVVKQPEKVKIPVDRLCPLANSEAVVYEDYSCLLNVLNLPQNNSKFFIMQLIFVNNFYYVFTRWGRVGENGQYNQYGPLDLSTAIRHFESKFYEKTGNEWSKRKSFKAIPGKWALIEVDFDAVEPPRTLPVEPPKMKPTFGGPKEGGLFSPLQLFTPFPANTSSASNLSPLHAVSPPSAETVHITPSSNFLPTSSDLIPMTKLLLLINKLSKSNKITLNEKDILKEKVLLEDPLIYAAFMAYERNGDELEFVDTLLRLCTRVSPLEKMSYQMIEIHSGSSTKTNNQSETTSTTLTKETTPQSNKQNTLSSHAVVTPYSTLIITTAPKIGNSELSQYLLDPSWREVIGEEFTKDYFVKLEQFILNEYMRTKIFPPKFLIFNAFNLCPFDKLRVVILGQDPYHDDGQAHGLCFSVPHGITPPPSLKNIYKELSNTISGFKIPTHGNLEAWARQGVFLLNTTLTVEAHKPNSHAGFGWETFTDAVIKVISERKKGIVFLLWGGAAQKKSQLIDSSQHHLLLSAHPSPLSANKFLGCNHFAQTNEILKQQNQPPIVWQI